MSLSERNSVLSSYWQIKHFGIPHALLFPPLQWTEKDALLNLKIKV